MADPRVGRIAPAVVAVLAALVLLASPAPDHAMAAVHAAAGTASEPAGAATTGVRRLAGPDRAATAATIAAEGWARADLAVLVDGHRYVAAVVGAHLAAREDAPVLVSTPASVPSVTAEALDALEVTRLIVVGDVAAPAGLPAVRVADGPAAGMSAHALDVAPGSAGMPVVLASAAAFADALAAANLAPARLLLTGPDALDTAAADAIRRIGPEQVVLLGGTAALSDRVAADVAALGTDVVRIAGDTRITTAIAAAHRAGGTAILASAADHADALAVVPLAARAGAAVLLTHPPELPAPVDTRLRHVSYTDVVITGGHAAVGNFVDRQAAAALAGSPAPGFVGRARTLTAAERDAMTGVSWHAGCPVGLDDLVALEVSHWTFDGGVVDDGLLVVNAAVGEDLLATFGRLFDARFPLQQVRPVEAFDGDDDASMAAGNTSAFNCRRVSGSSRWSEHAWGWAVDLNPVQNPFVRSGTVEPPAGQAYLDRADVRRGMVVDPGPAVAAFDAIGWGWGGRWSSSLDYQHFSLTGR